MLNCTPGHKTYLHFNDFDTFLMKYVANQPQKCINMCSKGMWRLTGPCKSFIFRINYIKLLLYFGVAMYISINCVNIITNIMILLQNIMVKTSRYRTL